MEHCGSTEERGNAVRGSALWGKGTRGTGETAERGALLVVLASLIALALMAPSHASAAPPAKKSADRTPPVTTITSGAGNLSVLAGPVTFTFAANEPSTFACSVDGAAFASCTTSFNHFVAAPAFGYHTFTVKATDLAGNVETAPPVAYWLTPYTSSKVYLPGSLLAKAQAEPTTIFDVIVQLRKSADTASVQSAASSRSQGSKGKVKAAFRSINGFPAKLPGWVLLWLADNYPQILSITPDVKVKADGDFKPVQHWQKAIKAHEFWSHPAQECAVDPATGLQVDPTCSAVEAYLAPAAPTIAVVDSGIDGSRADDFGARVVGHVKFGDAAKASTVEDGDGHGTFVSSIAAGQAANYPGVAPTAKLFDLRVMDDHGVADTSDVIAAADWILANKDLYGIKVANFSLHSSRPNSFKFDPLDRAVESLWFNGVTVVAASGNFGVSADTPSNMYFAPGNDPFVITVGAADTKDTADVSDDDTAFWSAFGYTADGFAKPEVVAPGRYMIGAVPPASSMAVSRPDAAVETGYVRLSGTSFASPAVAGIAANLLTLHPDWTPDQVKGALMQTAHPLQVANTLSDGVGEVDEEAAAALTSPVNPNAALNRFVTADATIAGGKAFDGSAWQTAAMADMSWSDMSWSDMSWSDMSWSDMSWSDMSWASMSWSDQSSADSSLADMSWSDGSKID